MTEALITGGISLIGILATTRSSAKSTQALALTAKYAGEMTKE